MKISVFTDYRFTASSTPTGVGKHIFHMVNGLAANDLNQIAVMAASDQMALAKHFSQQLNLTDSPTKIRLPWKCAEALWTLSGGPAVDRYCQNADWVYCPKNDFIPLSNTKLAITIHGAHELDPQMPQAKDMASRLNRMRRRLSYYRLVSRADLIFTVSDFLKGQIVEWFGCDENKIVVVGNGIEQEYFAVAERLIGISGYAVNKPYLLSVGGLNEIDGGGDLLHLASYIKQFFPELIIRVAGWQHDAKLLQLANNLDNIELLGYVPKGQLAPLMRDAVALMYLTKYETFGIAAIESMATGTPVITTGSTAVPETIGDAGLYVSNDPAEICATVLSLLEDSQLYQTMKNKGFQRAKQFTWDACVNRLQATLQQYT